MSHAAKTSPCIKVCVVEPKNGWCLGCARSLKEIASWTKLTDAERDQILTELPDRIDQLVETGQR